MFLLNEVVVAVATNFFWRGVLLDLFVIILYSEEFDVRLVLFCY